MPAETYVQKGTDIPLRSQLSCCTGSRVRLGSGHWSYDRTPADPQCSSVRCRRETWTRTLYSSSSWCCWSSGAGDSFTDVAPNPLSGARMQLDFTTGSQRFLRGRRVDSIPSRGPAVSLYNPCGEFCERRFLRERSGSCEDARRNPIGERHFFGHVASRARVDLAHLRKAT